MCFVAKIVKPTKEIIYRCLPYYRNKEWFDWIEIEHHDNRHDITLKHAVLLRTLLWLQLKYEENCIVDPILMLAKPLKDIPTPKYELLDCLGCDTMFHRAEMYDVNKVIGPVPVFPDVNFQKMATIIKKNIERNIWIKTMVATKIPNI